jgi:hypothetical protein
MQTGTARYIVYFLHNLLFQMGIDTRTTFTQLLHNLKAHWGEAHTMGLTPMCLEVVQ